MSVAQPLTATTVDHTASNRSLQRELYLFALYRVFEAAVLALVVFSPVGALIGELHAPRLAMAASASYLLLSAVLLARARARQLDPVMHVLVAVALDIAVAALATHALPTARAGIALMLLFNLAASTLFLPQRTGLAVAAAASLALFGEYLWNAFEPGAPGRPLAEVMMFA